MPRIGGCATFNGVTMINSESGKVATALRNTDGTITVKYSAIYKRNLNFFQTRLGGVIKSIPVLRELVRFVFMMAITVISLFQSSDSNEEKERFSKRLFKIFFAFLIIPALLFLNPYFQLGLCAGLIIIFYNKIRIMFKYHGAEHKSINMYEGLGYIPEDISEAREYSKIHIRCGTNMVSILFPIIIIYTFLIEEYIFNISIWLDAVCSLLLVGIVFEVFQTFQKRKLNWLFKFGLFLQKHITTKEPDDEHLEVALKALEAVLDE